MDPELEAADTVRRVGVAAVGGAIGLALGPPGAVVGAVAAVALDEGTRRCLLRLGERIDARPVHAIHLATRRAGITSEELGERLTAVPNGEDLFLKTIRAATDVALEDKLIALSQSLASAAAGSSRIDFESQLVGVIADLDEAHFELLATFLSSANVLGLGDGVTEGFNAPVRSLNLTQFKMCLPEDVFALVEPLLAGLERHGMVRGLTGSGMLGGGMSSAEQWEVTAFGEAVVQRMREVGVFLRPRAE